jgi:hypothetical protein
MINDGKGSDRRAIDTTPGTPATRSLSLGSSGGITGLMMAALMADTAPLQGD